VHGITPKPQIGPDYFIDHRAIDSETLQSLLSAESIEPIKKSTRGETEFVMFGSGDGFQPLPA
jgi:hypothetical protein